MRRFYAPGGNISENNIVLDAEQSRHLRNVLRLSVGENVLVFDGLGDEYLCRIERIENQGTVLNVVEKVAPKASESDLELILAVALLKGEKFELVIQKAVELGVAALMPLVAKRCESRLKDPSRKLDRWKKIVIESSKQTGRAKLMDIAAPANFASFVKNSSDPGGEKILFAESGGGNFDELPPAGKIIAAIGPEGGWEESEIDLARAHEFKIITLGSRVLRAETASIAVATILQHRFGDLD
jgi:16S rRNA (uracil1498-N3)-methyltransferase